MPSFKNLEISKELSNDSRVSVKSSFFGIFCTPVYQPTHSKISSLKKEYAQEDGGKLERILNANSTDKAQKIANIASLKEAPLGNYLLELCHSDDKQFVALRLFKFSQMVYQPVTELYTFEGDEAQLIISNL